MFGASGMNVSRCSVASPACVSVDPFEPVLSTVSGGLSVLSVELEFCVLTQ